ncbi:hypothetical protein PR048_008434 [Dryococelus australis]|uniref:Uncharacterized protein n=1 Tax=Dryococelus australis TaxID=614101 RepID=A0ABQ9HY00_9NEOP|nr:hypothetical protein PR048_008434 [Dryococelus australis]
MSHCILGLRVHRIFHHRKRVDHGRTKTYLPQDFGHASKQHGRSAFNPRPGHSGYSHVGIVPDDAVDRRVLLGDLLFPPPLHSGAAPYPLQSPSSVLKTSMLRAVQISSLAHSSSRRHVSEVCRYKSNADRVCKTFSFSLPPSKNVDERTTVAERLAFWPPTNAIRVQSPAKSLRIFACGNSAGLCRWSAGLLGDLPFPPSFPSGAAPYSPQSPSSALKKSMLRAVQRSSITHSLTLYFQHLKQ